MIIICEGMDNTGKTTLAKRLSVSLGIPYHYRTRPRNLEEAAQQIRDTPRECVVDRWAPISEPIYGPICRGSTWMSIIDKAHLMSITPDYTLVYCRPPRQTILNFGTRYQMEGVIQHADQLIDAYDYYCGSYFTYDYTRVKYESVEDYVQQRRRGRVS